jgi:ferrochelatase
MNIQTGILLINLGTPDAPTPEALKTYLAEFLSDHYVVDYPRWLWNPILNHIILRSRPPKSAALYASVWEKGGSPLLSTTRSIAEKLNWLNTEQYVSVGMRYGNPSIMQALSELSSKGVTDLIIFPLFPQNTSTTSTTAIEHALETIRDGFLFDKVTVIEEYHDNRAYILALADSIRQSWAVDGKPEKLLFSFHGIPQRYISRKGEPYEDQCYTTAALTAQQLGLESDEYLVSFQSRFGPEPWLRPYTDKVLERLGAVETSRLGVVCPGFAADCLETLEEIAMEGREVYEAAGGKGFFYIPALNDSERHVKALNKIIERVISQRADSNLKVDFL